MSGDFPGRIRERASLLDNIRVVLVSAKFPGNLGMTARAMKNTRISDLRLVSPRAELNKEAYKLALSGKDVLDSAQFHDTLTEAVSDCGLVIGTSRRRGVMRRNMVSPELAASMIRSVVTVNKVALVFGSEETGLSNDDLALCQWVVGMHTASEFESFNLSHSVAIICYIVNRAMIAHDAPARKLASAHDQENMYYDITRFLQETGFIHEKDPKRMMVTIRQILHRAGLSEREVKIIRGVLRQARWRIENPNAPLEPRDTPQLPKKIRRKKTEGGGDE